MLKMLDRLWRSRAIQRDAGAAKGPLAADGFSSELSIFPALQQRLREGHGLEIGGPSHLVFGDEGFVPVYLCAQRLDNCNFAAETVWEDAIREGHTFVFSPDAPAGRQFIAEASDLLEIADASYDYVLSSHCIEHLANPLRGIAEWRRVLKPGGLLILVLPHRDGTFDHRRPVTQFAHLLADHAADMPESDLTHLDEILALHDLDLDPWAGGPEAFRARALLNAENRGLHQHVFDTRLAVRVVDWAGLRIEAVELFLPMHIAIVAEKPVDGRTPDNRRFAEEPPVWVSPFPSDATSSAAASPLRGP
jgi:SAM-dependent methyltransferase